MKFTKSVLKRLIAQTKPKKLPVRNLDDNGVDFYSPGSCPAGNPHDWCYACIHKINEKHNKLVNELATELFVMICDKQEKAKWSDR